MKRDLTGKHYVYIWADGIHAKIRLEDDANKKQCMLVVMSATANGQKELISVLDGYRESEQSWTELMLDLKHRGLATAPKTPSEFARRCAASASVAAPPPLQLHSVTPNLLPVPQPHPS